MWYFSRCVCTLSRRPEWGFADPGLQCVIINTVCLIFMTFGFSQGRVFISFKSCLWWAKSPVLVSSILTATLFGVCCIPDVEGLGILPLKHNFWRLAVLIWVYISPISNPMLNLAVFPTFISLLLIIKVEKDRCMWTYTANCSFSPCPAPLLLSLKVQG